MSQHVSPWVYPVWNSLSFLDLGGYFLSHVREIFVYNLFKYFLRSFLFFPSGTPIMQMLVCLMLSQRSLRLSSFLFNLFSLFCSTAVISTILSSQSLILLQPPNSPLQLVCLMLLHKLFFRIRNVNFCQSVVMPV